MTPEVLSTLVVKVEVKKGVETNIDCKKYPLVSLYIDPANYEKKGHFNEELFRIHSDHEFTHLRPA